MFKPISGGLLLRALQLINNGLKQNNDSLMMDWMKEAPALEAIL